MAPDHPNAFAVLGVTLNSTQKEIGTAYRKLARICHPDKSNNSTQDGKEFIMLNKCYSLIGTEDKKISYAARVCPGVSNPFVLSGAPQMPEGRSFIPIPIGTVVELFGLDAHRDLNVASGHVRGWDGIRLTVALQGDARMVAVKPEKVRVDKTTGIVMRLWQGAPIPFCNICSKWSDETNISSRRHQKWLSWTITTAPSDPHPAPHPASAPQPPPSPFPASRQLLPWIGPAAGISELNEAQALLSELVAWPNFLPDWTRFR